MKHFKNVILVKHPKPLVWISIRDKLSALVPHLADVAAVEERSRTKTENNVLLLTNVWTSNLAIPGVLSTIVKPKDLGWTDHAKWFEDTGVCRWEIEPHFLPHALSCQGQAVYESAMGGRGTRITFEGEFTVSQDTTVGLPVLMSKSASGAIESLVGNLIAKNFRKVTDALALLLAQPNALGKVSEKSCLPA